MDEKQLAWILGFFETNVTFSINIGLSKSKNRRYVIFKPYIQIVSADKNHVKFIKKVLDLNYSNFNPKTRKEKYHKKSNSLNIQNKDDIDKILKIFEQGEFISDIKQNRFNKFLICYKHIKKVGLIYTSWDDEFIEIIKEKLAINRVRGNIVKNRISISDWKKKIIKHLGEVKDFD